MMAWPILNSCKFAPTFPRWNSVISVQKTNTFQNHHNKKEAKND